MDPGHQVPTGSNMEVFTSSKNGDFSVEQGDLTMKNGSLSKKTWGLGQIKIRI
jgi:hypothetical protein